jgi:glycolate oxidase iron-sulfur subunit
VCATFQTSGWEHESPRGRIRLAGDWMNGKIDPSSSALETFDACLACQACENVCPVQVPYGKIRQAVQEMRADLNAAQSKVSHSSFYKKWIKKAYFLSSTFWRHYFAWPIGKSFLRKHGVKKLHADFLTVVVGCMQDLSSHEVIKETLQVLQFLNFKVQISKFQPCCGALFNRLVQGGRESVEYPLERRKAMDYQEQTYNKFRAWLPKKQVCYLSKGCQTHVQKLGMEKQKDLYELILTSIQERQMRLALKEPISLYYQPYCGEKWEAEQDPIWRLFTLIEGVKMHLMPACRACCGGYGGESMLHPENSKRILEHKMRDIPKEAGILVASPDCYQLFAQDGMKVLYPIQIIAQCLFT